MAEIALASVGLGAAGNAGTAAMGALSLLQVGTSIAAGNVRKREIEQQAHQEGLAAKDQELERRRATLELLAMQNVATAAGGITGTGSAQVLQKQTMEDSQSDLIALRAKAANVQRTLRARGQNAVAQGRISAATSLLSGVSQISQLKGN